MAKFIISIAKKRDMTLTNLETHEKQGPYRRAACGCVKCGGQDVLPIGSYESIQEALYEPLAAGHVQVGDEFEYCHLTWRVVKLPGALRPHVFMVRDLEGAA